jgi:target of rapamycin complex subunit LST8
VWDLRANACSRELVPEGDQAIRSITVTPDGRKLCAANNPGRCYIWRLPEGSATTFEPLHKLQAHDTYVLKCVFSPDGKLLATTSADHTIRLWRSRDVQLAKVLKGHQRWVWDCAFSADSAYLVSASSDHTAKLWDLALGETIRNYTSHNKALTSVALNDVEPRVAENDSDSKGEETTPGPGSDDNGPPADDDNGQNEPDEAI